MITIGIDIGTTTISDAVMEISEAPHPAAGPASSLRISSTDGGSPCPAAAPVARLLYAENIPNDSFLPPDVPGARIQDAERILSLAKELLDRLLA